MGPRAAAQGGASDTYGAPPPPPDAPKTKVNLGSADVGSVTDATFAKEAKKGKKSTDAEGMFAAEPAKAGPSEERARPGSRELGKARNAQTRKIQRMRRNQQGPPFRHKPTC